MELYGPVSMEQNMSSEIPNFSFLQQFTYYVPTDRYIPVLTHVLTWY